MQVNVGASNSDLVIDGTPQGLNAPLESNDQMKALSADELSNGMNKCQQDFLNVLNAVVQMSSRAGSRHAIYSNEYKKRKADELEDAQKMLTERSDDCRYAEETLRELHDTYNREREMHRAKLQKISNNLKEIYHDVSVVKHMMEEDSGANRHVVEERYKEIFKQLH